MGKKEFTFSKHFKEERKVEIGLVENCVHTGRKELEEEPNKFIARKKYEKGELIVVYRDFEDRFFIITAFWNVRGEKYGT